MEPMARFNGEPWSRGSESSIASAKIYRVAPVTDIGRRHTVVLQRWPRYRWSLVHCRPAAAKPTCAWLGPEWGNTVISAKSDIIFLFLAKKENSYFYLWPYLFLAKIFRQSSERILSIPLDFFHLKYFNLKL